MIEKHLIPRQNPGFMLELFDDEVLLYHQVKTQAVYLNKSAAVIWALCNGEHSVQDIEDLLREQYPEAADALPEHIRQSLEQFMDMGALELK